MSVLEVFCGPHLSLVLPLCLRAGWRVSTLSHPPQAASRYRTNSSLLLEGQFLQGGPEAKPEILEFFGPNHSESLAMKIAHAIQIVLAFANGAKCLFQKFFAVLIYDLSFHFACGPGGGIPFCRTVAGSLGIQNK